MIELLTQSRPNTRWRCLAGCRTPRQPLARQAPAAASLAFRNDARKDVAPELVGTEPVFRQRIEIGGEEALRHRVTGSDRRGEDRDQRERGDQDQAGSRHPVADEARAPREAAAGCDRRHALRQGRRRHLRGLDPRIERHVDQVHQQVGQHGGQRKHDQARLDDRVVAGDDRVDQHPAEAGPAEDQLDRDRAGQSGEDGKAETGRDGKERVAQRVPVDGAPFPQPFRTRAVRT